VKYSLDTSALIEGWVRTYPINNFPGVWEKLSELIEHGEAKATDEVLRELERQDDDLTAWCRQQRNLFVDIDNAIQLVVTEILGDYPRIIESGGRRSGADPFVIALAKINNATVVTAEQRTNNLDGRVRIPDVCNFMSIRCIPLLNLITEERWIFA
jgi:hypothetical protein